ncbi:unnamed protein product [Closterium sp. NIES-53]
MAQASPEGVEVGTEPTKGEEESSGVVTPTSLTPSIPLTKVLGGRGLTTALLLLALTATGATPLRRATTSSTAASAASATAAASATSAAYATSAASAPSATATASSAFTAATDTSTPATTPTTTPTPSTATTTTSTTPASPTSALAPAGAASPASGRRSSDRLETTKVGRSSRRNRGQEGGGGTPLKDGGARVTTRGSYSDYARLCC